MQIIELFLNTFALNCSSKPETIIMQFRTTADKREIKDSPKLGFTELLLHRGHRLPLPLSI